MEAATALDSSEHVSLHDLRRLIGAQVAAHTANGDLEGTLVSCTTRSAWIVAGDVDHVVALPHLHSIQRR